MTPARPSSTEHARLATLLDIGRSLTGATDAVELRHSIASRLSGLFPGDVLFCSDVLDGEARVVCVAHDGTARRADQKYAPVSSPATPDSGCELNGEAARVVGDVVGGTEQASGALVVPVRIGNRVVAELGAVRFEDGGFDADDCDLLAFGAAIRAAALAQRARVDETETRRREAERLEEIGRAITSSLDIEEVLQRVMQAVLDLTRADVCSVWRREGDRSIVVASRGQQAPPVGFELDVAPSIHTELVTHRRSIQIADLSSDPRLPAPLRAQVAGNGPRSVVLVPMLSEDDVIAVLAVSHHQPHSYGSDAMGILERLALQAAIAIENARLHAEIRDLSLTDPLTGLPNRRHMEMVLAKEFEAARRGRSLTVVLLDLDDFKGYNDAHGHPAGDQALREIAAIRTGVTRAMNLAVRYGGDEFLAILSESTEEGAAHLVERIEQRVRANPRLAGIGVSAGIAQYSRDMPTPQALVEAADAAMYRRKVAPRAGGAQG